MLISWGLYTRDGAFLPVEITPDLEVLAALFRHKVLCLLQEAEAIDESVVANLIGLASHRF